MVYNYEEFLLEKNRIDFLSNRFVEIIGQEMFNKLIELDPSKKNLYSQWIINLFVKNKLKEEDFYKVTEYLSEFERIKNKLPNKDINFYKSLPELSKVLKEIGGTGKPTEDENYLIEDRYFINNGEAEIFTEDKDYLIVIPRTLEASKFYGKDTDWCTQYPDMFDAYTEKGDLYIIISKKGLNSDGALRRLQIHFEGTVDYPKPQFMDMLDDPMVTSVKKKFVKYFESKNNKWFLLKYDTIDNFKEGKAKVQLNGKCGFINENGEEVTPIKYDDIIWTNTKNIIVDLNGKQGIIDENGNELTLIKYDNISATNGDNTIIELNGKNGLIDKTGKEITHIKYDYIGYFVDIAVYLCRLNGKCGLIDETGKEITPIKYDNVIKNVDMPFTVILGDKWGLVNKFGEEITPIEYDHIYIFDDGGIIVQLNGKWGVIDKTGKEITSIKYDHINRFVTDKAKIELNGKPGFIDRNGKEYWD